MRPVLLFSLSFIVLLLSACNQDEPAPTPDLVGASPTSEALPEATETPAQATMPAGEQFLQNQPPIPSPEAPTASPEPPTPSPLPSIPGQQEEPTAPGEPIEVTYFTPSQTEGPYYPVDKPADRDNDLTVLKGAAGTPVGQVIEFGGTVYDATGMPQSGVLVEVWQTDTSGVYMHPGDPGTDQRDPNFQFYGESVTAADGRYDFRTILPGRYEPRPRHIHVKVKADGRELLTTQFYFADDPQLAGESMFDQLGPDGEHLIITLEESQDDDGKPILVGRRDIILHMDLSSQ